GRAGDGGQFVPGAALVGDGEETGRHGGRDRLRYVGGLDGEFGRRGRAGTRAPAAREDQGTGHRGGGQGGAAGHGFCPVMSLGRSLVKSSTVAPSPYRTYPASVFGEKATTWVPCVET